MFGMPRVFKRAVRHVHVLEDNDYENSIYVLEAYCPYTDSWVALGSSIDPFPGVPINPNYWIHQEKRNGVWVSVGIKYPMELIPCEINCLVA